MSRIAGYFLFVAASVALAACSPEPKPELLPTEKITFYQAESCTIALVADLPARIYDRRLLAIPVRVGDLDAEMLLDTGASIAALSPDAVKTLKLTTTRSSYKLIGAGGTTEMLQTEVPVMDIGGFRFRDSKMAVMQMSTDRHDGRLVLGNIGATFLSAFDLEFDIGHERVRLWGSKHCPTGFLPWSKPYEALPFQLTHDGHILLTMKLDGQPITAMVDTGAGMSTVSTTAIKRLQPTAVPEVRTVFRTVDGHNLASKGFLFHSMEVGGQTVQNPILLASNPRIFFEGNPEVVLGQDFLQANRLWLSYVTSTMFIAPAGN